MVESEAEEPEGELPPYAHRQTLGKNPVHLDGYTACNSSDKEYVMKLLQALLRGNGLITQTSQKKYVDEAFIHLTAPENGWSTVTGTVAPPRLPWEYNTPFHQFLSLRRWSRKSIKREFGWLPKR